MRVVLALDGVREASRAIRIHADGLARRAQEILRGEAEAIRAAISARFAARGSRVRASAVRVEAGDDGSVIVTLPYLAGGVVTARKENNPFWGGSGKGIYQPFQEVLRGRGYTEISPAPGDAIGPSSGAPGVRISARPPDRLVQEIAGV